MWKSGPLRPIISCALLASVRGKQYQWISRKGARLGNGSHARHANIEAVPILILWIRPCNARKGSEKLHGPIALRPETTSPLTEIDDPPYSALGPPATNVGVSPNTNEAGKPELPRLQIATTGSVTGEEKVSVFTQLSRRRAA